MYRGGGGAVRRMAKEIKRKGGEGRGGAMEWTGREVGEVIGRYSKVRKKREEFMKRQEVKKTKETERESEKRRFEWKGGTH